MRRATIALLVVVLAGPVWAQEVERMDPVVVTATRTETPAEQVGGAVTVVTGEEIDTYHYPTVDEALRTVPGVEIRRSGSFGKTTSISIRGANPNQVQVLVDGVRVKSPTTGQAELSDFSPDLIDRIEIIRGPQSTLYGADAIGGVVNIITKRGQGPFSAWAEQQVGNYDTLKSATGFSGSWRIFDYAFAGSHFESNGRFKNDGVDENALSARLGVSLPGDTTISLTTRYNRTKAGVPIEFTASPLEIDPVIDPNTHQDSETVVSSLAVHTRPVTWWESEARVSRYWNYINFVDPPDPFECPPITFGVCNFPARFRVERREAEWLNHFHVGKWSTSTIGLEYRDERANVQGTNGFGPVTDTVSGFFQEQLRFFDRLFMSAGVRVENNSEFGRSTTERGSLAYVIREWGTRIRGGAGSGFRAPTFNDLFFPGFSNSKLQPERSFSYDFGIDQRLWDNRIRLGLTYFQIEFKDLIACCVEIPNPPFVITSNIGRARSAGIEFTAEADLLDTLTTALNYTYTDTENLPTDRPLPREPRHRWNVRLTWTPTRPLMLFTEVHVVTQQWEPVGEVYNRGYTRWDVGGSYRILNRYAFIQSLDLTARVQNLLGEGYAEVRGFPALGRTALVGLRAAF
jgi:vitamin B12 transporter